MPKLILLFTLSIGFFLNAQTISTPKKNVKPTDSNTQSVDLAAVKRVDATVSESVKQSTATYIALQHTKYHLDRYLKTKNKESLNILIQGWSPEDQAFVKKDLAKMDRSLKIEAQENKLILKMSNASLELEIVNASEGRYRINGKALLISSFRKYEVVKKEISDALGSQEEARFHLLNLLVSQSYAIGFLAPLAPVVAPAATAAVTVKAIAVANYVAMGAVGLVTGTVGAVAGAYFSNKYAAHDFARNLAWYNPERVTKLMCQGKMSPTAHFDRETDCVGVKNSDMEVEIKRPDKEELFAIPNPKMDKKCEKKRNGDGFIRDAGITFHKRNENGEIQVKQVEQTHRLRFEFVSNPTDPKKLITKTMVETIFDNQGNREGQRIWTFDGDDFVIREYTNDQLLQSDNALGKHSVAPKFYDCTGTKLTADEVCKKMDKGLLAAAKPLINCNVDNPEQVIEQIKADKKEDLMNNEKARKSGKKPAQK